MTPTNRGSQLRRHPGAAYLFTGTVSSTSSTTVTMTTAGWTPNQWAKRVFVADPANPSLILGIISNTADTLTLSDATPLQPGTAFAIGYGSSIRESIDYTKTNVTPPVLLSKPVRFFRDTRAASFADGDATLDGICEVCHTQTRHFRDDGTAPDQLHANVGGAAGMKCTVCHPHSQGFKFSCVGCHGQPPVDAALMVRAPVPTGSTTPGAHDRHVNAKGYACTTCHPNHQVVGPLHLDGKISIGFSSLDGSAASGTYDGQRGVVYEGINAGTTVSSGGTKTCGGVACHGATMAPNGGTNTTPTWDSPSSGACGTCHGASAAAPPTRGTHSRHAGQSAGGYAIPCQVCHRTPPADPSVHVNNRSEVAFGTDSRVSRATYSGTDTLLDAYGACSNTYCHSNGASVSTGVLQANTSPLWGATASLGCAGCHGYPQRTGRHSDHSFARCNMCHVTTTTSGTSITNPANHANGAYDVAPDTSAVFSQGGRSVAVNFTYTFATGGGRCINVACHAAAGEGTTKTWTR